MISEILKFNEDTLNYLEKLENNPDMDRNETLEHFIRSHGYSELFQKAYLVPICASVWPCSSEVIMNFSAFSVLSFCRNHHLLQLFGRPQWLTVKSRSHSYVKKVREELESRSCQIRTGFEVKSITSTDTGCCVHDADRSEETYDACVIGVHAPDALKILGNQATYEETRILGAFQYAYSVIYVHRDTSLMPKNQSAWSAWNFLGTSSKGACLTYWLNLLQNLGSTDLPFLMTLNTQFIPKHTILKWETSHPIPSVAASKAFLELDKIQGKRGIWYCGAYQGHGSHEDGLKAGMDAANGVLGKNYIPLRNPKHMVPSWAETGARAIVTKFLKKFIVTGSLTLLEEGGTIFVFEGEDKKKWIKSVLKVHNPLFYWKVATEADFGFANAYINGYFSFVDEHEGLQDFFTILIANRDLRNSSRKTGWWTPLLLTAGVASARYYFRHISSQNTITQARRNISQRYDLSNDFFSRFLNETMTYSLAIFKSENEDLKVAQIRKISLLIEKARISCQHEILKIGCGWGSLAIEVVKQTGCKYAGITLSKEQLHYAKRRAKEAGLEVVFLSSA
ncbi:putative cyclopropane-fatty-acyl-phospholipid synthase [Dioscorea sansibarensis]